MRLTFQLSTLARLTIGTLVVSSEFFPNAFSSVNSVGLVLLFVIDLFRRAFLYRTNSLALDIPSGYIYLYMYVSVCACIEKGKPRWRGYLGKFFLYNRCIYIHRFHLCSKLNQLPPPPPLPINWGYHTTHSLHTHYAPSTNSDVTVCTIISSAFSLILHAFSYT